MNKYSRNKLPIITETESQHSERAGTTVHTPKSSPEFDSSGG